MGSFDLDIRNCQKRLAGFFHNKISRTVYAHTSACAATKKALLDNPQFEQAP